MTATIATAFNPLGAAAGSHAGHVSPAEAWDALQSEPRAQLIDVRTHAEWTFCGTPNMASLAKRPHLIAWKSYPTMELNGSFIPALMEIAPTRDVPLYFLCKTGGRSHDAALAMTQAGYTHCYNIAAGFEGDRDADGHRGKINGWKAAGLPWEQA